MDASPAFWEQQRQTRLRQLHFDDITLADSSQRLLIREKLLQDIDSLTTLTRAFRSHVNQTSSISRLPAELMLYIFRHLAEIDRPLFKGLHTELGWIRASRVCRSWREIMLGARDLWANEVGVIPRATSTFLQRAGDDSLLRVKICCEELPLDLIYSHTIYEIPFWRARSLSWTVSYQEDIETALSTFAGEKWEALQELYTVNYLHYGSDVLEEYQYPYSEPFYAPNLVKWISRSLYIRLQAQSLVTLHISGMHLEAAALLDILAHAPALQIVTIIARVNDDTDLRERLHANMVHLCSFKLDCADISGEELGRAVISHISFPSSTELYISAEYMDGDADCDLLATALRGVWPQQAPISATISSRDIALRPSEDSGYTGSRTIYFGQLVFLFASISTVRDGLSPELDMVEHLSMPVAGNMIDVADMWIVVDSLFPAVRRLDLTDGQGFDDLANLGDGEPQAYFFARLEHLRLAPVFLLDPTLKPNASAKLVDLLRDRVQDGAGPHELWLEGLVEPPEGDPDAEALRALVPIIHWLGGVNDGDVQN